MKTLYLEARKKFKDLNLDVLSNLPGKSISLAATVQYLPVLYDVKEYLQKQGKKVILKKGPVYEGHVLGCNSSALSKEADTLLLITDGTFHAINNAVQLNREIYVFNGQSLDKVTQEQINRVNAKQKAALTKYFSSDTVGILVSSKYGQNFKAVKEIKQKIEKKGKKVYVFESDAISLNEFENFKIPVFINTACYGLGMDDSRILNLQNLLPFL